MDDVEVRQGQSSGSTPDPLGAPCSNNLLKTLLQMYLKRLKQNPVLTKAITRYSRRGHTSVRARVHAHNAFVDPLSCFLVVFWQD